MTVELICIASFGKNLLFIYIYDTLMIYIVESEDPPTFESVIHPIEKARVPLYYCLYTGKQLGVGKAGRYYDAFLKVKLNRLKQNHHSSIVSAFLTKVWVL